MEIIEINVNWVEIFRCPCQLYSCECVRLYMAMCLMVHRLCCQSKARPSQLFSLRIGNGKSITATTQHNTPSFIEAACGRLPDELSHQMSNDALISIMEFSQVKIRKTYSDAQTSRLHKFFRFKVSCQPLALDAMQYL